MILIHPYAKPLKQWNMSNWHKVVAALKKYKPVIVGLSSDHIDWDCQDMTNRTSLLDLIILLNKADLLVTVDSGPMHMAFLEATPTVALFGNINPSFVVPKWANCTKIYKPDPLADMPRRISQHEQYQGKLQEITVDEVVKACETMLSYASKWRR